MSTSSTSGAVVAAADTVVVNDSTSNRPNILNEAGIQKIKGGQTIESSLFDSVQVAYANLCNSPMVLMILILLLVAAVAESNGSQGPFELVLKIVTATAADDTKSQFVRTIALILKFLFTLLVQYKIPIISAGLMWFPYFAKPSKNNMHLSLFLTAVVVLTNTSMLEAAMLSQLYFLYTQIRTPTYRTIILSVAVVIFVIGLTSTSQMLDSKKTTTFITVANATSIDEHVHPHLTPIEISTPSTKSSVERKRPISAKFNSTRIGP